MKRYVLIFLIPFTAVLGQDAHLNLRDFNSYLGDASSFTRSFRSTLYPTWKFAANWDISEAIQVTSDPFFFEEFHTPRSEWKGKVLQSNLSCSRAWKTRSLKFRVGPTYSSFELFPSRYDDTSNGAPSIAARQDPFFSPVRARPRDLPANTGGFRAECAGSHWNFSGDLQRVQFDDRAIPTRSETTGSMEITRALHPRLYIAARAGYLQHSIRGGGETYEFTAGFLPNSHQLIKLGYSMQREDSAAALTPLYTIQLVTMLRPFSIGRH